MSTEYYRLKSPFTSIRLEAGPTHTILAMWVNHANIGYVTLRNEEVSDVLGVLRRDKVAVIRYSKGDGKTGLQFEDNNIDLDTQLICQSGYPARIRGDWDKPDEWYIED